MCRMVYNTRNVYTGCRMQRKCVQCLQNSVEMCKVVQNTEEMEKVAVQKCVEWCRMVQKSVMQNVFRMLQRHVQWCRNVDKPVECCRNVLSGVEMYSDVKICRVVQNGVDIYSDVKMCREVQKHIEQCGNVQNGLDIGVEWCRNMQCRMVLTHVQLIRNIEQCRNVQNCVKCVEWCRMMQKGLKWCTTMQSGVE